MRRRSQRPNSPGKHDWRGKSRRAPRPEAADKATLFGLHAVEAALANPRRQILKVVATENAAKRLGQLLAERGIESELASPRDLDRMLGADAVHQGVMLEAEPLTPLTMDDADPNGMIDRNTVWIVTEPAHGTVDAKHHGTGDEKNDGSEA